MAFRQSDDQELREMFDVAFPQYITETIKKWGELLAATMPEDKRTPDVIEAQLKTMIERAFRHLRLQ